uniref:Uncharacterized protein n=1 Tax=Arundo donax TaxID=35708 RepID=A0A0A8ZNW1_ARUDO
MPLLVSAIVRVTKHCEDDCPRTSCGDCGDRACSGCYDSDDSADDRRGESVLLKGLSQVTELEFSVHSRVGFKIVPYISQVKDFVTQ